MAVLDVQEDYEGRQGEWSCNDGRSYARKFIVTMSGLVDGPNVAIQAVGINRGDLYLPFLNNPDTFEYDFNAYCNRISATLRQDNVWDVMVEYGPYSALFAGGGPAQNPLLMPVDVSWATSSHEIVFDQDVNAKAVTNAAGDPFDPPLMEEEKRRVITVVRNESTFDPILLQSYDNAVNSDTFALYPPLMCKVLNILPKSVFHQDVGWYYQITYEFECLNPTLPWNVNGYRRTVLNQGVRALTISGTKYHISYKGIPVTEPVLLNLAGQTRAASAPPTYLVFQSKPELPFAAFNFDQTALVGQRTGNNTNYGNQGV